MEEQLDISNLANNMMCGSSKTKPEKKAKNNKKKAYNNYQNNTDKENKKDIDVVPYVGAPYNFVSFSEQVYEYTAEQFISHGVISEELFTGELKYRIEAQTPMIIDDGKGEFYKNPYGIYAIPGSTIRGLIRNNVQILGFSSMNDDIDDYTLMYRNVASGKEKDRYNDILGSKQILVDGNRLGILLHVKAGYIKKEQNKYVIYQTCVDSVKSNDKEINYYVLSERTIVKEYLLAKKYNGTFSFEFFERNRNMQHEIDKDFEREERKGRVHYKGKENKQYQPYFAEISYELAGNKKITAVGEVGQYKHSGYVISTGKMNEKKAIYIIPKVDKPIITIPDKDIKAFQIDIEKRKNTLKNFGDIEFFDLPEEGILKPVFYIQLAGRLYFGFTPRLRLFYGNTIKEGLPKQHKSELLDYAKALFGYSNRTSSYKSRVSFSDAVVVGETNDIGKVRLVLSEPKPTSYSDYLKPQNGQAVTYNENFELRGTKQYWLRKEVVPFQAKNILAESEFCPLKEGTVFEGKVRFKNLTKEELGLLLWSIKLNENSWMNVGKGKAYGYGVISLNILSAKKLNLNAAYKSEECLDLNPWEDINVDEMILSYKDKMSKFYGKKIDDLPHIKEFFTMKDSTQMPEKDNIRYMSIDAKEYQSRKDKVLPSIEETVKIRKISKL